MTQQLGKGLMPRPQPTLSGVRNGKTWSGMAGPCTEVTEVPLSPAHGERPRGTLTAWRDLDAAASKPSVRGKGNGHTSCTHLQTEHAAGGCSAEVRRHKDTSAALEPPRHLTCFPTTAWLLCLGLCLPLPTLPPGAPHSSTLPLPLLSAISETEQALTATHHPAPSSCFQSH